MANARNHSIVAILLAAASLESCQSLDNISAPLLQLRQGLEVDGPPAEARGVLTSQSGCMRVAGGGSTVIIWPRTANARSVDGGGTTIIVWPRTAVAQRGGGGTVVIIWSRGLDTGASVRAGDRVEIEGIYVENVATLALAAGGPAGCRTGPAIVAREVRLVR